MNTISIFTGAGASKALDYPTTAEFFTLGTAQNLQQHRVYREAAQHLRKTILDVEDILRLLYPIAALHKTATGRFIFPSLGGHWIHDIPEFVSQANKCCFDHYGRLPNEADVKKLYVPLLDLCDWQKQKVCIFTTNYDPVTDVLMEIAEAAGISSYDGFNRFGGWDSGGFSRLKTGGLAVHRLHGSMSWVESDNRIRNTRDYSQRAPGYAEHLIIYPGFKGNPELEGHPAFRHSHSALRTELGESSVVLVIGFSFRDPHLNDIFREAMTTNHRLRLVVWNPEWPEGPDVGLEDLYQEFDKRIVKFRRKFGDPDAPAALSDLIEERTSKSAI